MYGRNDAILDDRGRISITIVVASSLQVSLWSEKHLSTSLIHMCPIYSNMVPGNCSVVMIFSNYCRASFLWMTYFSLSELIARRTLLNRSWLLWKDVLG